MLVLFILSLLAASGLFVLAALELGGKIRPINNAYLYASKAEREKMDTKPLLRQSATVFSILGVIAILLAIEAITKWWPMLYIILALVLCVIVYAIASTIKIEKNKNG